MDVNAILKQKGRDVETVDPKLTVMQAAGRLARKRIGAAVVVDGHNRVQGIVSERDIIRDLGNIGASSLDRTVEQMMTRSVVTCSESDTLDQLMNAMTTGRFRHMPVVRDGHLVGIVSIGDVVKYHVSEIEMEHTAMKEYIAHH